MDGHETAIAEAKTQLPPGDYEFTVKRGKLYAKSPGSPTSWVFDPSPAEYQILDDHPKWDPKGPRTQYEKRFLNGHWRPSGTLR